MVSREIPAALANSVLPIILDSRTAFTLFRTFMYSTLLNPESSFNTTEGRRQVEITLN
jgi:hypothetical protein